MNVQQILKKVRIIKVNENSTDVEFFTFCFFPRAISNSFVSKYYTHVTPPLFFFFFKNVHAFFFCTFSIFYFPYTRKVLQCTVTLIIQVTMVLLQVQ